jgi:hypothetical protein
MGGGIGCNKAGAASDGVIRGAVSAANQSPGWWAGLPISDAAASNRSFHTRPGGGPPT